MPEIYEKLLFLYLDTDVVLFKVYVDSIFIGVSETVQFKSASVSSLLMPCTENWQCDQWGSCINGQQTKNCVDSNNCGTTNSKPAISQACIQTCAEDWQCDSWSSCTNNQRTRACTELNNCGTTNSKPNATETCVSKQEEKTSNAEEQEKGTTITPPLEEIPKIKDTKAYIETNNESSIIRLNDFIVKTNLKISVKFSKVYVNTSIGEREIQILPEEAAMKSNQIDEVYETQIIDDGGEAVYFIKGVRKVKLFGIFTVLAEIKQKVSAETGKVLETEEPWWIFLSF